MVFNILEVGCLCGADPAEVRVLYGFLTVWRRVGVVMVLTFGVAAAVRDLGWVGGCGGGCWVCQIIFLTLQSMPRQDAVRHREIGSAYFYFVMFLLFAVLALRAKAG